MPYNILKITIRICAHPFPFAAKIRDVAPTSAAISIMISNSGDKIFDIPIKSKDTIQRIQSFCVKFLIGKSIQFTPYKNI
jgi:hypothetical protein